MIWGVTWVSHVTVTVTGVILKQKMERYPSLGSGDTATDSEELMDFLFFINVLLFISQFSYWNCIIIVSHTLIHTHF